MAKKYENLEDFEKDFEKANDRERWAMVIANQHFDLSVDLDNDCTTVSCGKDEDFYLSFNDDIGSRGGIIDLLKVAGIKADYV